jgi:hypothetical protein
MGRGEEFNHHAHENDKVLSDAMEALIAALCLDTHQNYSFLKEFITEHWIPIGLLPAVNYKEIESIIYNYELLAPERLEQVKEVFNNKYCTKKDLASILLLVLEESEVEIFAFILETVTMSQSFLNAALMVAIEHDAINEVKLLISHGASPNTVCKKYPYHSSPISALGLAHLREMSDKFISSTNSTAIAEFLISKGAHSRNQACGAVSINDEIAPELAKHLKGSCYIAAESYSGELFGNTGSRYSFFKILGLNKINSSNDPLTRKRANTKHELPDP